jgi:Flp pilus assembly protein TadG
MRRANGTTRRAFLSLMRLLSDRKGNVAVITAMSLTSLLGFAGLGTEATLWYVTKRNMQGAADTAAFTAATALAAGQNAAGYQSAGKAIALQYGFDASCGANGSYSICVTSPPTSGAFTTNASAVEVVIQQPQTMMFANLFLSSSPTILARAVAAATGPSGPSSCVIALDRGNVTDVMDSGTGTLNMPDCGLQVNSTSSSALSISGTASINAKSATIVGNYSVSGHPTINITNGITTGGAAMADPYANVNIPSYTGCNSTATHVTTAKTLTPVGGVYVLCNGLSVSGQGNLTLQPGVYVINGGSFSVSGGATVTGDGVTIIMTNSTTPTSTGSVSISGGSKVTISAPTTGATAGLAFFQDRGASNAGTNSFSGGATQSITGAIYFPNQAVSFSGNTGNTPAQCTQLIGYTLTFSGTSTFNASCSGLGLKGMGGTGGAIALVE